MALLAACSAPAAPPASAPVAPPASAPVASAVVASRAYRGHGTIADMSAFVAVYPATAGTRLDDCHTCHRGGTFTTGAGVRRRTVIRNACDFCHLLQHPEPGLNEAPPRSYADTLNPYGADYAAAGRSREALRRIAGRDSDGDGASNEREIAALKYPGDARSRPGQRSAPLRRFTLEQLQALPTTSELLLVNTPRQYDAYCTYTGVKLRDLLAAAGVDLAAPGLQGVTIIAPDGYLKDVPLDEVLKPFPTGRFHAGLDVATRGRECGFVSYPKQLPPGLADGAPLPGPPWLMLAWARDGERLDSMRLDVKGGKIGGEGPLRLVVPQRRPGRPDRGSRHSPTACNDGLDFDRDADHNAGDMVRGVVGVRVNPLPPGLEDFDAHNGGWAFVESRSVFVYGFGVRP